MVTNETETRNLKISNIKEASGITRTPPKLIHFSVHFLTSLLTKAINTSIPQNVFSKNVGSVTSFVMGTLNKKRNLKF